MKHLTISMMVCGFLAGGAWAQEEAAAPDWVQLRAEARALRQKADQMRAAAQSAHDATHKACWDKFLVSSCQQDARGELRKAEREARQFDSEALVIERRVQAHDRETKRAKKLEKIRKQDEKAAQRAEKLRLEEEKRLGAAAPAATPPGAAR